MQATPHPSTPPEAASPALTEFVTLMAGLRPRLHRYCARMTGSFFDGEDVV